MLTLKAKTRVLIALNKTERAIQKLKTATNFLDDKDLYNEVLLQSARFEDYQKQKRIGTTSFEEQRVSIAQINEALLYITNKLPGTGYESPNGSSQISWWQFIVRLGIILGIFASISKISGFDLKNIFTCKNSVEKTTLEETPFLENSIFTPRRDQFNVLIVRFEDYLTGDNPKCIGRSIQERLNLIAANESLALPLITVYSADSIKPPVSKDEALAIQARHHADLIIYGLARQVEKNCMGAEVCFRYSISDEIKLIATPSLRIRKTKHDLNFIKTSPMAIEEGKLKVDTLSMRYWINSLINFKANKKDAGYRNLAELTDFEGLNLTDEEKARKYLNVAIIAYSLGDYHRTIENCENALLYNPKFAEGYFGIGNCYTELGEYTKAIFNYNKAIEITENSIFFGGRGTAHFKKEEYQKSIIDYTKAINLDPENEIAFYNRGVIFRELKEYTKATTNFTKAIELKPNYEEALYNRGLIYIELHQYNEAIKDFTKVIELNPNNGKAFNRRAIIYSEMKRYDKAIEDLNKAINLSPKVAMLYNNLGLVLIKNKGFKEAKYNLEKSQYIDPNNSLLYRTWACYYLLQNKKETAYQNLEKAVKMGYNDLEWLKEEEILTPIRDETRFNNLLNSIN